MLGVDTGSGAGSGAGAGSGVERVGSVIISVGMSSAKAMPVYTKANKDTKTKILILKFFTMIFLI